MTLVTFVMLGGVTSDMGCDGGDKGSGAGLHGGIDEGGHLFCSELGATYDGLLWARRRLDFCSVGLSSCVFISYYWLW